jgi:UDP-N-acetylmuramoyl-tripeptide--D-alanyl-D-alanine ligase
MELGFTLREIAKVAGGKLLRGDADLAVESLSTDSRTVLPGELFIPLVGERFDGHDYLSAALVKGVQACICQQEFTAKSAGFPNVVLVKNTLIALQKIAEAHRAKFKLHVVALTGSCGKTMVKELAAAIISTKYRTLASAGNVNNEVGLPLQVLNLLPEHEAAVLELGTNHPGELEVLCRISKPTAGIWTNVGMGHIGYFGSLEEIQKEKSALVKNIPSDGVMVLNADDPLVIATGKLCQCKVVTFGMDSPADYHAEEVTADAEGVHFLVNGVEVKSGLIGKHSVSNILAALALAAEWGIDLHASAEAIAKVVPLGRRLLVVRLRGITLIDDCYNSNPTSLAAALQILHDHPAVRRIAILGDMNELGAHAIAAHQAGGELAARLGIDRLYLTGDFAPYYQEGAVLAGMYGGSIKLFANKEEMMSELLLDIYSGDVILVKASHAVGLETVSDAIKCNWGEEQ